ncbi:MAG: ribbon-helix-helix protein, CopG family [Sphaerochaetaceae bacterium]
MGKLIRFGVSMESELVKQLDELTEKRHWPNRSETIRSLVRDRLALEQSKDPNSNVVATISVLFDYKTKLDRNPIKEYPSLKIVTNLQTHVSDNLVIKVLIVTGKSGEVESWSDKILGQKGIVGEISIGSLELFNR